MLDIPLIGQKNWIGCTTAKDTVREVGPQCYTHQVSKDLASED